MSNRFVEASEHTVLQKYSMMTSTPVGIHGKELVGKEGYVLR